MLNLGARLRLDPAPLQWLRSNKEPWLEQPLTWLRPRSTIEIEEDDDGVTFCVWLAGLLVYDHILVMIA